MARMFPLHERTRRRVGLAIFVALSAVPAVFILLWGLHRQMPWHASAEARQLARLLGLRVQIEHIWHAKPGQWHYNGFSLHDPEDDRCLFRCERLEVTRTKPKSDSPTTLLLHAHNPTTDPSGANALFQLLWRAMQAQIGPEPLDVQWTADRLAFGPSDAPIQLEDLSGSMKSQPEAVLSQLQFRLAGSASAEPAHIELHRNRQTSPAGVELKLYTGAGPLPCRLLAVGLPAFQTPGPDCRFRGYLRADRTSDGWLGELTGHFSEVDFGQLVQEQFAQHLTGVGQLTVERAGFNQGRIEYAWGSIAFGPGTLASPLLDNAVEQMSLIRNSLPGTQDGRVAYQELAANWQLTADGLRLEGRCASGNPGTLLVGTEPWQVGEPVIQPLPVAALVRTLVPHASPKVPATCEAEHLLRHLPLPHSSQNVADPNPTERLR